MDTITRIKTTTPNPYPLTAICINTHDTKTFRLGFLPMPPWIYFPAITPMSTPRSTASP